MRFLTQQYLQNLIESEFKDMVVTENAYFVNAVARTKAEEMIKVPIMNLIQNSSYGNNKDVLNELTLKSIEHECIFTTDTTSNKIDLAIATDHVTDILEFKVSYAGEFYNRPITKIRETGKIPDGIYKAITDLDKRHNDTSNVMSILMVKDIVAPNGLDIIPGNLSYVMKNNMNLASVLVKDFHLEESHLENIHKMFRDELIRTASDKEHLFDFEVAKPFTVDLGPYKDQLSVRIHFFIAYDKTLDL